MRELCPHPVWSGAELWIQLLTGHDSRKAHVPWGPLAPDTHGKAVMVTHPCLLLAVGEERDPLIPPVWYGDREGEHRNYTGQSGSPKSTFSEEHGQK